MSTLRGILGRVAELWRKESRDRELDEEMSSLLEMEIASRRAAGMSQEEARRAANMRLSAEYTKELYRDRRGLP